MDKASILQHLFQLVEDKINTLEALIEETRTSNNDTKSSMGDKYETGREMLQQEINNLQSQKKIFQDQMVILRSLTSKSQSVIEKGALVTTNTGKYFLSISLGKILINGETIFCISQETPLAKVMMGKKTGESFSFNSLSQVIIHVE